jgi:hypothetical protein
MCHFWSTLGCNYLFSLTQTNFYLSNIFFLNPVYVFKHFKSFGFLYEFPTNIVNVLR